MNCTDLLKRAMLVTGANMRITFCMLIRFLFSIHVIYIVVKYSYTVKGSRVIIEQYIS